MGMDKQKTGQFGEKIACRHLGSKGYRIIERNLRESWGEIDVIARAPEGALIFVEVKTVNNERETFKPEDHYSWDKARKTKRAVQLFIGQYPNLVYENAGFRIDLITIVLTNPLLTENPKNYKIRHYENV